MARSSRGTDYVHLGIRVDSYQVAVGKSINLKLLGDHADPEKDEPVFTSDIKLEIVGVCIWPESRANEKYEITVYEEDVKRTEPKVDDILARNDHDVPIYRKRRGREVPVYKVPAGFCVLKRNRDIATWQACIWVEEQLASDILAVLTLSTLRPIYVAMDERIYERKRWIDSLRVQTINPTDE